MSDIEEYTNRLKNWESEPITKRITDILIRVQKLKSEEGVESLNIILDTLGNFHKQANKAEKDKVDENWFKQVIKSKNHVKTLIENIKKSQVKLPKLIKSNSQIEYPQQFMEGKGDLYKSIMKSLYKNFLINMDESTKEKKNQISEFLDKVIKLIFQQFGLKEDEKIKTQQKVEKFSERVQNIYKELSKTSARMAKNQMIQGIIDPVQIAKCEPDGFIGFQAKKIRQERIDAMTRENQTGFYDELKKNINKDANQQCRYCHKPAAYCQGQKQIRASDEPMTRFMVCNLCGKRWRQD